MVSASGAGGPAAEAQAVRNRAANRLGRQRAEINLRHGLCGWGDGIFGMMSLASGSRAESRVSLSHEITFKEVIGIAASSGPPLAGGCDVSKIAESQGYRGL